ncbi:MAG: tetratricopeptide repeat protein [Acidobacteria bacterium]|nr:MAG: tetratricopeptide repeat protein [Acidobacteriota bacterium]
MLALEHYEKGMDHFSEDRLDEAIAEFGRALEADPGYADAFHALAMCHYHKGEFDQAIEWGQRYRAADPDNPLAYTSLSMFYQAKGMITEAEEMGALAQQAARREQKP